MYWSIILITQGDRHWYYSHWKVSKLRPREIKLLSHIMQWLRNRPGIRIQGELSKACWTTKKELFLNATVPALQSSLEERHISTGPIRQWDKLGQHVLLKGVARTSWKKWSLSRVNENEIFVLESGQKEWCVCVCTCSCVCACNLCGGWEEHSRQREYHM